MNIELDPSGGFRLDVPSVSGTHTITVPCTEKGLRLLRKVLQKYASGGTKKIGHDESPTQWQVEAWLKADAEAKHSELLASLDIDLEITL